MQGHLGRTMSVAMWSRGKSLEAVMPTEVRISPHFVLHVMDRSVIGTEDFCAPRKRPTRQTTRRRNSLTKRECAVL